MHDFVKIYIKLKLILCTYLLEIKNENVTKKKFHIKNSKISTLSKKYFLRGLTIEICTNTICCFLCFSG